MASSDYQEYKYPNNNDTSNKCKYSLRMIIDSLNVSDLEHRWTRNSNEESVQKEIESQEEYIQRINQQASNVRKLAYMKAKFIHNYGEQEWPVKISDEEKEEYISLASSIYNIPEGKIREEIDDRINDLHNSVVRP